VKLKNLHGFMEWIEVSKKLPPKTIPGQKKKKFLTYDEVSSDINVCYRDEFGILGEDFGYIIEPTHWMPLPPLPGS